MYPIINVSHWEWDMRKNASGTREKFYLIEPETNNSFLFKIPMENTGEAWAEKIAAELGKLLGFNMMDISFAMYEGRLGVLLRNFVNLRQEQFFDGGDLLKAVDVDFHPKSLNGYHITNILRAISPYRKYNVDKDFINMLIFDALIANQDRHCENWGIIQSHHGIRMAPFFDNGASLGRQNDA